MTEFFKPPIVAIFDVFLGQNLADIARICRINAVAFKDLPEDLSEVLSQYALLCIHTLPPARIPQLIAIHLSQPNDQKSILVIKQNVNPDSLLGIEYGKMSVAGIPMMTKGEFIMDGAARVFTALNRRMRGA